MPNYDHVINGAGSRKLGAKDGQDTEAALADLRLQLGTITATVARLERRTHERQRLNRIATLVASALAIWGVIGLVLLRWFF
jgi:hypothetical protein